MASCWVQCQSSIGGNGCGPGRLRSRLPGDGQHGVADRLGVEPLPREAPEPAIVGIERGVARVEIARELVGLRRARSRDGSP